MEHQLNLYQHEIDTILLTDKSKLSYKTSIFPIAAKVLELLNTHSPTEYPRKITLFSTIDIYIEGLTLKLIHTIQSTNNNLLDVLPIHCLVLILTKHLYLISLIQSRLTYNEYIELRHKLTDECKIMFGDDSLYPEVIRLNNLLTSKLPENHEQYIKQTSAIQLFNYLIDFNFEEELIGITSSVLLERIMNNRTELNKNNIYFLSINTSYNLHNTDSIIIYHSIPKRKEKLLNVATIDEYNAFEKPKYISKRTDYYELLNSNFEKVDESKVNDNDYIFVVLNYNNDDDNKKCKYTVGLSNKRHKQRSEINNEDKQMLLNSTTNNNHKIQSNQTNDKYSKNDRYKNDNSNRNRTNYNNYTTLGNITKNEFIKLINGASSNILNNNDISLYLEMDFYNNIADKTESFDDLKNDYLLFVNIIKECFNYSTKQTIAANILKHPKITKIFDKVEIPFLKSYLNHISDLLIYDLPTVSDYCLAYIYPNLFGRVKDFQ